MYTTTPSAAATLLAASGNPAKLDQLLSWLGFTEQALPLDELARERLGLPCGVSAARVARGEGELRALLLTVSEDVPPLEIVAKTARRFSARMPHLLWLAVVLQPKTSLITIAVWSVHTPLPRIAALTIDTRRVSRSDAETVCALTSYNTTQRDMLRHARWLDILGREAVIQRLYRTLESVIDVLAESLTPAPPSTDARQLALLCISRLLFLSFIETKGWLNHDCRFLSDGFTDCMAHGDNYHRHVLMPLFFGTLHTAPTARALRAHAFGKVPFLNGGLFCRTQLERLWRSATFSDDALRSAISRADPTLPFYPSCRPDALVRRRRRPADVGPCVRGAHANTRGDRPES